MPTLYQLLLADSVIKKRAVPETAQSIQYLGHSIICKHSDLVYIIKFAKALSIKGCPKICYTYLSSFKKSDVLPILKAYNIIETGKVVGKYVDQGSCGMISSVYAFREAALIFL